MNKLILSMLLLIILPTIVYAQLDQSQWKASGADASPSIDKSVPAIETTQDNKVIVNWYLVGKSLGEQTYEVSIKNKATTNQDFWLSFLIEDTNYDASKFLGETIVYTLQNVKVDYSETTYSRTCSGNLANGSVDDKTCSMKENKAQKTKYEARWVEHWATDNALSTTDTRKEMGLQTAYTGNTRADQEGIIVKNGEVFYRITFKTPIIKNGEGFGSSGTVGIYVDSTKHHPFWNDSWGMQYNLQLVNPDNEYHNQELISVNLSANGIYCSAPHNWDAIVVTNVSGTMREIHSDLDRYNGTLLFVANLTANNVTNNDYMIYCDNPLATRPSYRPMVYLWDNFNYTTEINQNSPSPINWQKLWDGSKNVGRAYTETMDFGYGNHKYLVIAGDVDAECYLRATPSAISSWSRPLYATHRTVMGRAPQRVEFHDGANYQTSIMFRPASTDIWLWHPDTAGFDNGVLITDWTYNETMVGINAFINPGANTGTTTGIYNKTLSSAVGLYTEIATGATPSTFRIAIGDPLAYYLNESMETKISEVVVAKEPMYLYNIPSRVTLLSNESAPEPIVPVINPPSINETWNNAESKSLHYESFRINTSIDTANWTKYTANLYFNGANYTATNYTNGVNIIFEAKALMPFTRSERDYDFHWTLNAWNLSSAYENGTGAGNFSMSIEPAMFFNYSSTDFNNFSYGGINQIFRIGVNYYNTSLFNSVDVEFYYDWKNISSSETGSGDNTTFTSSKGTLINTTNTTYEFYWIAYLHANNGTSYNFSSAIQQQLVEVNALFRDYEYKNDTYALYPENYEATVTLYNTSLFTITEAELYFNGTNHSSSISSSGNNFSLSSKITLPYVTENESLGHYWIFYYLNSSGSRWNVTSETKYQTIQPNLLFKSFFYKPITYSLAVETYSVNISFFNSSLFTGTSAILNYNGTNYTATSSGSGTEYKFTRNVNMPLTTITLEKNFTWYVYLSNSTGSEFGFASDTYKQTILGTEIDNCSGGAVTLINFTLKDEETQVTLNESIYNLTTEVDVKIFNTNNGSLFQHQSFAKNNTNPVRVCMNDLNNSYYMDVAVRYDAGSDYVSEWYHIQRYNLTNSSSSIPQLINLYDLDVVNAQSFIVTYKNRYYVTVSDVLIDVQRYYNAEGLYKTVEIAKTDVNGQAIVHLVTEDVKYKIVVKSNGSILSSYNDVYAYCTNPSTNTCLINLYEFKSTSKANEWLDVGNVVYNLSMINDDRAIILEYETVDGTNANIGLNISRIDRYNNNTLCVYASKTASSGTYTCTIPSAYGNGSFIADLYLDGSLAKTKMFEYSPDMASTFGYTAIYMGAMLFLVLPLVAVSSPILVVVFSVLGFVVLALLLYITGGSFLTSTTGAGTALIWLVVSASILIWKLSGRRGS